MSWLIHICQEARTGLKRHEKKWRHEVRNVVDNLDTLFRALGEGTKPEQLKKLGFVHSEPLGILAIDQTGLGKGAKMKAMRLYVYPCVSEQKLYVLMLGDKQSQSNDLKHCKEFVAGLLPPGPVQKDSKADGKHSDVEE